jgi:hypothetical protein
MMIDAEDSGKEGARRVLVTWLKRGEGCAKSEVEGERRGEMSERFLVDVGCSVADDELSPQNV